MANRLSEILHNIKNEGKDKKGESMNKYVAVINSICDGCVNGAVCQGKICKRKQTLLSLAKKYELVSSAFDRACEDLLAKERPFDLNRSKEDIKKGYLDNDC